MKQNTSETLDMKHNLNKMILPVWQSKVFINKQQVWGFFLLVGIIWKVIEWVTLML